MADTATNPPTGPSGPPGAGDSGPSGPLGAGTTGPSGPAGATAPPSPSPRPSASPPPAAPPPGDDWAKDLVDRLDEVVAKIRSNTTDRLVRIGRLIVLGLLAAIFGVAALILVLIALVRALDVAIPGPVWEVYVMLGAIFVVAGVFLWTKKDPRPARR